MGKKWRYRCGLQTQVLIAILCLTQYTLAAPLKTEAAKKEKPGAAAKSSKSQPTKSATVRSHTKIDKTVKQTQTTAVKKPPSSVAKVATAVSTTKSRKSSFIKAARPTVLAKNKRAAGSKTQSKFTQPKQTDRHRPRIARASASKQDRKGQSSRSTKGVRVVALKETKDHKYVKTIVTIPTPRTTNRSKSSRSASSLKSPQKPLAEALVTTPAPIDAPLAVTEAPRQPTLFEPSPLIPLLKSEPPVVSVPSPEPAIPLADQPSPVPPTPAALSSLPALVDPPQEPAVSSELSLAALKKPEAILATEPERPKPRAGYTHGRAAFTVKFNGERLHYRLNSAFVLPGDEIFVEVVDSQRRHDYTSRTTLGKERQLGPTRWYWHAPSAPGVYLVKVQRPRSNETVTLNVFVMVPLDRVEGGFLNGYRVGHYPTVALRQQPIYTPPRGLIEVTRENEHMLVSPHFCLRQFLCKQDSDYPKYMVLDARLLTALELLLEKANAGGYQAHTFTVMSGYRTPYYNRAIGNSTTYSRHVWGDAADIFIDENPKDGRMDDLNQDGEIDSHDAEVLYDLIEGGYEPRFQSLLVGGLARYRETSSHGPFVHVDVRGVAARWGARRTTKGIAPSTLPVVLRGGDASHLPQPSYWEGESEMDATP